MGFDKRHSTSVIASAAVSANRFVDYGGAHATSSANVRGVSETFAEVGRAVSLITGYSSEVVASEEITVGAYVKPAADGSGRAAVGTQADHCGRALDSAAAAGARVEVRLIESAAAAAGAGTTINGSLTAAQLTIAEGAGTLTPFTWYRPSDNAALLYYAIANNDLVLSIGGNFLSGAGGADRTAGTPEADPVYGGTRPAVETVNGVPWTWTYDVYGRPIAATWAAGGLARTIDYGAGIGIASGNVDMGGVVKVTVSQMATLKTALAALGSAPGGSVWFVSDFDGTRGLTLEWDASNGGFRGVGGAPILVARRNENDAAGAYTGSTAESGDRYTATVPGWLRHKNSHLLVQGLFSTTGVNAAKTLRVYHGGVNSYSYAIGTGAANNSASFAGRWANRNDPAVQIIAGAGAYDGNGISSAASPTGNVNTANDTGVALRYILGNAADSIIFNCVEVLLHN